MSQEPAAAALERARLLIRLHRFDQAQRALVDALALAPDDADAHALLGWCLSQDGRGGEAERAAATAVRLAPDRAFVHRLRGLVLLNLGRPADAEGALREALRLNAEDVHAHGAMARAQRALGFHAVALRAAEAGLAIDPEDAGCTGSRLLALEALGRFDEARAAARAALARNPDHAFVHARLGHLLVEDDPAAAAEHLRTALRHDPGDAWTLERLVQAVKGNMPGYRRVRRLELASWLYEVLMYVHPRHRHLFPAGTGKRWAKAVAAPVGLVFVVTVIVPLLIAVFDSAPEGGPGRTRGSAGSATPGGWTVPGLDTSAWTKVSILVPGGRYAVADGEGGFRVVQVIPRFDRVRLRVEPEVYPERPTRDLATPAATPGTAQTGARCLDVGGTEFAAWGPTLVGYARFSTVTFISRPIATPSVGTGDSGLAELLRLGAAWECEPAG